MRSTLGKTTKLTIGAGIFLSAVAVSFLIADTITESTAALQLVSNFGYVGVVMLAVFSGLNVVFPIPVAVFTPVFLEAGLQIPYIIAAIVTGIIIADFTGYIFGRWSRDYIVERYPRVFATLSNINDRNQYFLLPAVFLYAAIIPLPNEAIVIPLALIGVRFSFILLPLILGNIVNQTMLVYGASNIFTWLF